MALDQAGNPLPVNSGAPNVTLQGNSVTPTKEAVEKAIRESNTLVEALESVAAMYQIPASNIIVDDRAKQISVSGDCITTPDMKNPSANTKAIVCAIGAVLDNISQRIDQKLNTYQANMIAQNKAIESQRQADPSKGEVVGRFTAADGSEIIAYSSGLVDMNNSPEALAKVRELRSSKQIPDFISEPDKAPEPQKSSYFSDEEADIMQGVKTNDDIKMDIDKTANDLSMKIGESAYFMDLMDKFDGTTTLGYDLLHATGFDFVQPTHAMIQESETGSVQPPISDLKHMRFDNTNIMKAVSLFNAARLSFMETEPSLKDICRNDKFKEGIRCIERQFDCHLAIRFYDTRDEKGREMVDASTTWANDINQPITVSKSKGFQLHGTPIDIDFAGKVFRLNPATKNRELFGQVVTSYILHEIWHNVVCSLEKENGEFVFTLSSALAMASSTDNKKLRRTIISNCVNTLDSLSTKKMKGSTKSKLAKRLLAIASTKYDKSQLTDLKNVVINDSSNIEVLDKYIAAAEKYVAENDPTKKARQTKAKKAGYIIRKIIGIGLAIVGFALIPMKHVPLGLMFIFIGGNVVPNDPVSEEIMTHELEKWMKKTDKDEYYADLFASMYQFPVIMNLGPDFRGFTANNMDSGRLQKLVTLEREIGKLSFDPHPSAEERAYSSLIVAKKLLNSGEKLNPDVKKYCEWIVANFSQLEETDIGTTYAKNLIDPKESEDLDQHLHNVVKNNNITVTESAQ